eukprot:520789-Karenia_brevis.AAC.1
MLYFRLRPQLERFQCFDQVGFRPKMRIENALLVCENLVGTACAFNLDVWIGSLDLRKAFDRVEYSALFEALTQQGISSSYIHLLRALYSNQTGKCQESSSFPILRGVKQGDILSSLLFNAALEMAFGRWKRHLSNEGWLISAEGDRLTNIRYADDCLIYAKSPEELRVMMELLLNELNSIGLN